MKKAIAILVIFILIVGIIVVAIYFRHDIADFFQEIGNRMEISDEISRLIPDKNPDSIVIPEDATEEEKSNLQQERLYWQIIRAFKTKVVQKAPFYYSVVEIWMITRRENRLYFETLCYCDSDQRGKVKLPVRYSIECNEQIDSAEKLLQVLENFDGDVMPIPLGDKAIDTTKYVDSFERTKNSATFMEGVVSYEEYYFRSNVIVSLGFSLPTYYSSIMICKYEDGDTALISFTFSLTNNDFEITDEGIQAEYAKGAYMYSDVFIYDDIGIGWREMNEKYKLNDFEV